MYQIPTLSPLGYDLINHDAEIRGGSQVPAHALFQIPAGNLLSVDNEVFNEQLIYHFQVSLIKAFRYPSANESLVLFQAHSSGTLPVLCDARGLCSP